MLIIGVTKIFCYALLTCHISLHYTVLHAPIHKHFNCNVQAGEGPIFAEAIADWQERSAIDIGANKNTSHRIDCCKMRATKFVVVVVIPVVCSH